MSNEPRRTAAGTLLTTDPAEAGALARQGEVVAFPTETVYGLGAAMDGPGVEAVFDLKGRPPDNPLILHVPSLAAARPLFLNWGPVAESLGLKFWPGPLTLVSRRASHVPPAVTAGLDTVAVRVPRHPGAQAFLREAGSPVAAPSANLSGRPSPTTADHVLHDFDGRIPCILLEEGPAEHGMESTVVDITVHPPRILRRGSITREDLAGIVPGITVAEGEEALARSPGTRHRHYAPSQASVELVHDTAVAGAPEVAWIGLHPPDRPDSYGKVVVPDGMQDFARRLYGFFRECDTQGLRLIRCLAVPETGLGAAIMDRIRRAAQP